MLHILVEVSVKVACQSTTASKITTCLQHVCNIEKNFELTIYKTYNNSMLRYVYIVVTREVSLTNN